MKVSQDPTFKPITIILECREEAEQFINIIDTYARSQVVPDAERMLAVIIANELSNKITL